MSDTTCIQPVQALVAAHGNDPVLSAVIAVLTPEVVLEGVSAVLLERVAQNKRDASDGSLSQ